jgi:hypothetical protein
MKRQFLSTILMMSTMMGVSACGGGSSNGFVSSPSTGGGTGGGTDSGGTGGVIQNNGIYINNISHEQPLVTYLHQFYQFNLPCTIPSTASDTDIQCLLNVRELDFAHQGLKLEFNVPPGMCDYVSDLSYSFYNRRAGWGPQSIDMVIDDGDPTSNSCTVVDAAGTSHAGTISGHSCSWPGGVASTDGTVSCDYDYSDDEGPNCCQGSYNFSSSLKTAGATEATVISTINNKWGGYNGLCLAGPFLNADSGWKYNTKYGNPAEQIRVGINGFNHYYKIEGPISLNSANNTFGANFWDWTSYAIGLLSPSALPIAMQNNPDKFNIYTDTYANPNPAYVFNCLDQAMEVKHRIRLYINEWDTSSAFLAYGVAGAVTNSPVATGNCDITNGACDDIAGWSQYPTSYPNNDLTPKQ